MQSAAYKTEYYYCALPRQNYIFLRKIVKIFFGNGAKSGVSVSADKFCIGRKIFVVKVSFLEF